MADRFSFHLRHIVAILHHHQVIDSLVGIIYASPYITCLVRGIGFLEGTSCMRMIKVFFLITIDTLWLMGMLQLVRTSTGVRYCIIRTEASSLAEPSSSTPNSALSSLAFTSSNHNVSFSHSLFQCWLKRSVYWITNHLCI